MEKSFVGDPVNWPGLVYAPLNNAGLIYALGTISGSTALLFEEFSGNLEFAVCRRRTPHGWERIKIAFAVQSSSYRAVDADVDLLVCWIDDVPEEPGPPRLALSQYTGSVDKGAAGKSVRGLESILPDNAAADLLERGHSRESYEETVRLLDEQIKKLQNG